MTRLASLLAFVLLLAAPAWACQYGSAGSPTVGLAAVNSQTLSVTSTAVGVTLPTTWASDGTAFSGTIHEAVVYVTSGTINFLDNGNTPVASATIGGAPFGTCTNCAPVAIDICGKRTVSLARFISQSGTSTLVILFYGTQP